jgi:hypothetical protein
MKQQKTMDVTGAALLVGFAIVLAFNQVVIKVNNDGFQPAFQAGTTLGWSACFDLGLDDVENPIRAPAATFMAWWGHGRGFCLLPNSYAYSPRLI